MLLAESFIHETVINTLPLEIFWKDYNFVYQGCNDSFAQASGLSHPKDVVGMMDKDFDLSLEYIRNARYEDINIIKGNRVHIEKNLNYYLPGGEKIIKNLTKTPLKNSQGQCIGILCTMKDITVHQHNQQELFKAKQQAELANRAKSEFLANMSHELRTPLSSILGLTNIVSIKTKEPEVQEHIQAIYQSGEHLLSLINDVLEHSKIEADLINLSNKPFDLLQLVKDSLSSFKCIAEDKGINLETVLAELKPGHVMGDKKRLRQIIINLMGNAIKFTDVGYVQCQVVLQHESVSDITYRFSIRDTGQGIPPEDRQKIFERFTQGDSSYSKRFSGTGLGLAITRQLVHLMSGKISFDSELFQGSTFWFELTFPKVAPVSTVQNSELAFNRLGLNLLLIDTDLSRAHDTVENCQLNNPAIVSPTNLYVYLNHQKNQGNLIDVILVEKTLGQSVIKHIKALLSTVAFANALTVVIDGTAPGSKQSKLCQAWLDFQCFKPKREPHILVVEDNKINQRICQYLLKDLSCTVDCADNGRDAIAKLNNHYDCIFMDLGLPDLSGFDIAEEVRLREQRFQKPRTPILAMTAHLLQEDKYRCFSIGIDDIMMKPLSHNMLKRRLIRWTNRAN